MSTEEQCCSEPRHRSCWNFKGSKVTGSGYCKSCEATWRFSETLSKMIRTDKASPLKLLEEQIRLNIEKHTAISYAIE